MKNINKKIIDHADIEVEKVNSKVIFKFSMLEVKYNKLMNSKVKSVKKSKQPTTKDLLLALINKVDKIDADVSEMKNTPTMKKELGLK